MADFGIELSFNNRAEYFVLPVNPESIEITENGRGKTYDVVGLGEINVIKNRELTEVSFQSIFPAIWYPFVVVKESLLLQPAEYLDTITKWMDSKRPIRFIAASSTYAINMAASIEKFQWKELAGSPGDIEYSLTLKKYVFYAAKKVVVAGQNAQGASVIQKQPPQRPDERPTPKTHTIASGENLWLISKKLLGDGSRYKEIQKLNGLTDAQLKALKPGTVLRLPQGGFYA